MNPRFNQLKEPCALTRYLEDASQFSCGAKAYFAGGMLAELGYFKQQDTLDIATISALLRILLQGQNNPTLSEINKICGGCSLSGECGVGGVILKEYKSRA